MRFTALIVSLAALISSVSAEPEKRALAKVYRSCTGAKQVAITFDDGPYIYDAQLQAALAKHKAKATFFVNVKNWGCAYDDSRIKGMRDLFREGHEFGSHTYSHANISSLTWDKIHSEMWKAEQLLIRVLGVNPALFRPPYGAYTDAALSAVGARNQSAILWDFDSEDTLGRTAASTKTLYDQAIAKKVNNILALNHSISNSTASEVIPYALDVLSKAGYKFVTVSECLGIKPYQFTQAQGVKDSTWVC